MARGSRRREKREERRRRPEGRTRWGAYLIAVGTAAVIVAVFIVVGVLSRGGDGDGGGGPVVLPSPRPADMAQEGRVLGSADAPVSVIEYADFQ